MIYLWIQLINKKKIQNFFKYWFFIINSSIGIDWHQISGIGIGIDWNQFPGIGNGIGWNRSPGIGIGSNFGIGTSLEYALCDASKKWIKYI